MLVVNKFQDLLLPGPWDSQWLSGVERSPLIEGMRVLGGGAERQIDLKDHDSYLYLLISKIMTVKDLIILDVIKKNDY